MNRATAIGLVARREIRERLRSRLVLVATAVMAALVVALVVLPGLMRAPASPTTVGLVGSAAQSLRPTLREAARGSGVPVVLVDLPSRTAARSALDSGKVDVTLAIGPGSAIATIEGSSQLGGNTALAPSLETVLRTAIAVGHEESVLAGAGVPGATIRTALTPLPFSVRSVQHVPADQSAHSFAALAAAILLWVALAFYGTAIAAGVAQEKTSRMAEVLLTAVRPVDLLIGKVIGIGAFGVGQMAIAVGAGLAAIALSHDAALPPGVWALFPMVLVWFLLGYALYAFACAAAGALVGRPEEVQSASTPLLLPLFVAYGLTFLSIAEPGSWLLQALAVLPPLAPVPIPVRLALGALPAWILLLAVLTTTASIIGLARLAARIYAPALVGGGKRLTLVSALRLADRNGA